MARKIKAVTVRGVVIGGDVPVICMPIVGRTQAELAEGVQEALELRPDVVEWRADHFQGVTDAGALLDAAAKIRAGLGDIPVIFTLRDSSEGGAVMLEPEERAALIEKVVCSGYIDLVDLELAAVREGLKPLVALSKGKGVKVILSNHFFTQTPSREEMVGILRSEQEAGADIAKLAVMPTEPADVLALLSATEEMRAKYADIPLITMSMGQTGLPSRVCGGVFGNALTFGAGKNASAAGQIDVGKLREGLALFHS